MDMRLISSSPRFSISQSFLLIGSLRSVEQARRLLRETRPRWLVVDAEDNAGYYLLPARDFEAWAAGTEGAVALRDIVLTRGLGAVPAATHGEAFAAERPCVVVEDGIIVGVFGPDGGGRRTGNVRFGGGGGVDGPNGRPELGATQYLQAALPEEAAAGELVVLLVTVGPEGSQVDVEVASGAELDVIVQAREGFAVEGSAAQTVRVPNEGATAHLEFRLRARVPGPGLVRVYAFDGGTCLGTLTLRPVVRPAPNPGGRLSAAPASVASVASVLNSPDPFSAADLSLLILEERDQGRPMLSIRVTAQDASLGLNMKEFGPVVLGMEPIDYFGEFFGDIELLGQQGMASGQMVRQKLESKGARLFESIFPGDLQALLWSLRDRIASVQIYSEEPWIPWELCRLTGESAGIVAEGPFFCEAFAMTRWIPGIARRPRLTLSNMALVVPRNAGLAGTETERRFLLSLGEPGRSVQEVQASYVDVRGALASGTYDSFHFAGHGTVASPDPDRSAIRLEDGEELRPDEISGVVRNLGRTHPLVFLNSCHGARGAFTLAGAGGWARRYLDAGAGAFIGAYWAVSDRGASDFAASFYREMHAGSSLAAAVRAARLAIRSPEDPTWLAYTVYGDPSAMRWTDLEAAERQPAH